MDRTPGEIPSLEGVDPGADEALSCDRVVHSERVLPMQRGAARRNCFDAVEAAAEGARATVVVRAR